MSPMEQHKKLIYERLGEDWSQYLLYRTYSDDPNTHTSYLVGYRNSRGVLLIENNETARLAITALLELGAPIQVIGTPFKTRIANQWRSFLRTFGWHA